MKGAGRVGVAFLAGMLTAIAMAMAFFLFLGIRIGFSTIWEKTGVALTSMVLDMPDELVDEIAAMDAVIGNAGNPTGATKHDSLLVEPDAERVYVLRKGVSVEGYQIRSTEAMNLDPPVVYMRSGSELSEELRAYLEENTRVRYRYRIDDEGFRNTVPVVEAERTILMVGDSGIYGVGVDDENTIASRLQRLVGDTYRILNAGVAGYDGSQAFTVARQLSDANDYAMLIYVAHINDFYEPHHISNPDKARRVIDRFTTLRDRFPEGIIVAFLPYLQFTAEELLLTQGWSRKRVDAAKSLLRELPAITREARFPYVGFEDIARDIRRREKTIFAPWALYTDHAHVSPRGAQLFAERIQAAFREARPRFSADSVGAPTVAVGPALPDARRPRCVACRLVAANGPQTASRGGAAGPARPPPSGTSRPRIRAHNRHCRASLARRGPGRKSRRGRRRLGRARPGAR
jgi:lysophospholipase L1-like esterase